MKKIAFVLLPFLMVFFNSCELTNEPFYHFVTEEVSAGDANTLVQYNVGQYDILYSDTALVSSFYRGLSSASESNIERKDVGFLPEISRVEADHRVNKNFFKDFEGRNLSRASSTSTTRAAGYCGKSYSVGNTRYFYIFDSEDKSVSKKATLKYKGKYCDVWFIDNAGKNVNESELDFKEIANSFDKIYGWETQVLGGLEVTSDYVDIIQSQSKVVVIVADLFEDSDPNQKGGTFGYCYYSDMISMNYNNYSNECCSIYLDSWFYKDQPKSLISTIPHEFNHLLNFINKYLCKENMTNQNFFSTWYTEMLAMVAEDMCTNLLNITDVIDHENNNYDINTVYFSRLPWFRTYSNLGFGNWRDETEDYIKSGDVYASYANAYAFGAFLMRNYGGFNLLSKLAKGPDMDEEAITKALKELDIKESDGTTATFWTALKNYTKIIYDDSFLKKEIAYEGNNSEEGLYFNSININDIWTLDHPYNNPSAVYNQLDLGPYGFYAINYDETLGDCSVTYIKGQIEYYFCKL